MARGGERPGAGRKKDTGEKGKYNLSLSTKLWREIGEYAEKTADTKSGIVEKAATNYIANNGESKMREVSVAYKWGQALALFDAATPGGLSAETMTGAVERPLLHLAGLVQKIKTGKVAPEIDEKLTEQLGEIPDLPEQYKIEEQGQVYLGYYNLRHTLPPSPVRKQ